LIFGSCHSLATSKIFNFSEFTIVVITDYIKNIFFDDVNLLKAKTLEQKNPFNSFLMIERDLLLIIL
jgi:hypothetical protein